MKSPSTECMKYIFNPRSIAIIGVSTGQANWNSQLFLRGLLNFRYSGKIYPVNPKGGEILGLKVYPGIRDIPGAIDYAYYVTPAQHTPSIMEDCAIKGVKVVCIFSAGFSESDQGGKQLESTIVSIAQKKGTRVIGPNCMGAYCPSSNLSYITGFPKEAGKVAFISQSGGNVTDLVYMGASRGIRFSKTISYGNACDLNETDFLEYLVHDPDTEIIAAYIEGVKDGPRFLQALKEATAIKPVVMLKGGKTSAGSKAVASHTGQLAGKGEIWEAIYKQSSAIAVSDLEEMVDTILAFLFIPSTIGHKVAILTSGGGAGVRAADECESAGLSVPPLPSEAAKLSKFTLQAGCSVTNPVDSEAALREGTAAETVRVLLNCPETDLLVRLIRVDAILFALPNGVRRLTTAIDGLITAGAETSKPIVVVLRSSNSLEAQRAVIDIQKRCYEAGFPVYPTVKRAANAISKFLKYHQDRGE